MSKIPVSWLKEKGIELAVGDILFNELTNQLTTLNKDSVKKVFYRDSVDHLKLSSFADRPNTGKQPVGHLVVDIVTENECMYDKKPADNFKYWWADGTITYWKPNFDALHELHTKETTMKKTRRDINSYLPNDKPVSPVVDKRSIDWSKAPKDATHVGTKYNLRSSPICWFKVAGDSLQHQYEDLSGSWSEVRSVDNTSHGPLEARPKTKPVFSQAMADAGELPQPNEMVMFLRDDTWLKCKYIGISEVGSKSYAVCWCPELMKYVDSKLYGSVPIRFKPVDTRSDKEKLRDALTLIAIPKQVDQLLASDKFTITLNKDRK